MATTSILFLGTPHKGSPFPSLARLKALAGNLIRVHTEERLLQVLNINSDLLSYLQNEFEKVQSHFPSNQTQVYCYCEEYDVKLGPLRGKVVPEDSAWLDNSAKRALQADHMGMNKFHPDDGRYENTVKPDLLQSFRSARRLSIARFSRRQYGSDQANPQILAPLTSSQEDRRNFNYRQQERTVQHRPTCTWIHHLGPFNDWKRASGFSCLWIHGKSGSGKSVLAAYISKFLQPDEMYRSPEGRVCLYSMSGPTCGIATGQTATAYFLCGVEPALESPSRLIGTLIHQLLARFDENWKLQAIALSAMRKLHAGGSPEKLAKLLAELASIVGPV